MNTATLTSRTSGADSAPEGYRLIDDARHEISLRDLVFVGGMRSYWQPARRAGEAGGLRCYSAALAVAAPLR